jgi:hypothetical protein
VNGSDREVVLCDGRVQILPTQSATDWEERIFYVVAWLYGIGLYNSKDALLDIRNYVTVYGALPEVVVFRGVSYPRLHYQHGVITHAYNVLTVVVATAARNLPGPDNLVNFVYATVGNQFVMLDHVYVEALASKVVGIDKFKERLIDTTGMSADAQVRWEAERKRVWVAPVGGEPSTMIGSPEDFVGRTVTLFYPLNGKGVYNVSQGLILENKDGIIYHSCASIPGASGAPIMAGNRVIALNQGPERNAGRMVGLVLPKNFSQAIAPASVQSQ